MNAALVPLEHYLLLSGLLFTIGTAGVFLRRNLITLLLSVEIMLNAVNLAFVAFGRQFGTRRRTNHHVLRHDRRSRRSGRWAGAGDWPVPPSRVAQPGSLYGVEVVIACCR